MITYTHMHTYMHIRLRRRSALYLGFLQNPEFVFKMSFFCPVVAPSNLSVFVCCPDTEFIIMSLPSVGMPARNMATPSGNGA